MKWWTERLTSRLPASKERTAVFMSCAWITKPKTKTLIHFSLADFSAYWELTAQPYAVSLFLGKSYSKAGLYNSIWQAQRLKTKQARAEFITIASPKTMRNLVWPRVLTMKTVPKDVRCCYWTHDRASHLLCSCHFNHSFVPAVLVLCQCSDFKSFIGTKKVLKTFYETVPPSHLQSNKFFLSFTYKVNLNTSYLVGKNMHIFSGRLFPLWLGSHWLFLTVKQ